MKHLTATASTSLLFAATILAQSPSGVAGHWEGELEIPGQALVIKVDLAQGDGGWTGTIDIPAQGGAGIPLADIEIGPQDGVLKVGFAMQGVPGQPTFDGSLNDAGEIRGTFSQSGARLTFRLSREAMAGPPRPQEPKPPFPYEIEPVQYSNGDVRLAGTLTLPGGDGPFPAVLLISGSGPQDRDETIFEHKPFWVLADHLTRAGIAVLRVDDPGVGESTAHPTPPTTADFATDVDAGIAFLKARPDVDPGRIGLIGHSEGGAIAPMVASRSSDVAFVVLLAGPGVTGRELLIKQNERILDAAGVRGTRRETLMGLLDRLFDAILSGRPEAEVRAEVEDVVRGQMEANGIPRSQQDEAQVKAAAAPALTPWMRYFLAYDPRPALEKTTVPVLAINGTLDLQVDADQNLPAIATALQKGGNGDVTIRRFEGLNHLFQHARSGMVNEYGTIEETMSPEVLDLVRDWILAR